MPAIHTNPEHALWLCLGHHKCASTTQHKLFGKLCSLTGRRTGYVGNIYPDSLADTITQGKLDALSLGNTDPDRLAELPPYKGFHLIRDPRDIVISAYYSHRNSHPTDGWEDLATHREKLNAVSEKEGLLLELDFWPTKVTLQRMAAWDYHNPNILECRFEDFITDIPTWINRLCTFWEIEVKPNTSATENLRLRWNNFVSDKRGLRRYPLPTNTLDQQAITQLASELSFKQLSGGRTHGDKDASSHYRSGKPGEWQQFFDDALKDAFLQRFPTVIQNTGYPDFD